MPRDVVDYFVNIRRPIEIREDVLTTSNDIILLLKRTEKIKSLRVQKKQTLEQIKSIIKEINAMNTQLKHALPRVKYAKETSHLQKSEPKINENYMNQLKELQKAIGEIEDRLKGF